MRPSRDLTSCAPPWISREAPDTRSSPRLPPVLVVPLAAVMTVSTRPSHLLFAETERLRCGQRLLADRLFEVLLVQLLRWLLDHSGSIGASGGLMNGLAHPKLARALSAVHERPSADWTLESMANVAGMSRSAFASEFKTQVGATPGGYLLQWRHFAGPVATQGRRNDQERE
jgi:hypothetical protein